MPYNGAGLFNRIYSWLTDAANGVDVRADRMDTDTNDIATGLSNCITRDGQSPATANIPMGGFKVTGLANGTTSTDAVALGQLSAYAALNSSPIFTGAVQGPDGLVGSPTYTFSSATTTGMYLSAGTLTWTVGGANVMFANASGFSVVAGGVQFDVGSIPGEVTVAGNVNVNNTFLVYKVNGTQVVEGRHTGYSAIAGTPNRATAYDTATITLAQLAQRVKALQDDLTSHGLIGT